LHLATSRIKDITDATFDAAISETGLPSLVEFFAPWCAPCTALSEALEEVAGTFPDALIVSRLDVEDNYRTARRYSVLTIPTLILFQRGRPVERMSGLMTRRDIERRIRIALNWRSV